jgi:UDP-N-acetylmuramoyl-tripeptide--D-alanyl-D-alanine ligase
LAIDDSIELAIIEMGANKQGDIKELAEICEPTHGFITNIGKAHLEGFGGVEGVRKGKVNCLIFYQKIIEPFLSMLLQLQPMK